MRFLGTLHLCFALFMLETIYGVVAEGEITIVRLIVCLCRRLWELSLDLKSCLLCCDILGSNMCYMLGGELYLPRKDQS